ncbi:hypothetical protein AHF37_01071 [Paragonimus kellicotti]|nr:hypothetical protein AHF37_01071 [Paragonimus kellicotti]
MESKCVPGSRRITMPKEKHRQPQLHDLCDTAFGCHGNGSMDLDNLVPLDTVLGSPPIYISLELQPSVDHGQDLVYRVLNEIPHLECTEDEPIDDGNLCTTYTLFREYWFQWGRLENCTCVIGFHPEYLECYKKMQALLFHADLPLPYPDRHYLAVLVSFPDASIVS